MSIKRLAYDAASDGTRPRQQARPAAPRVALAVVSGSAIGAPQMTERPTPLPEAARRLRLMFPDVWARYEALLAARAVGNVQIH